MINNTSNETMICGKEFVIEILSQKIISEEKLEEIFSRTKTQRSFNITVLQKTILKEILAENTLGAEVKEIIRNLKDLLKSANYDDTNERYSFADIMFNPKFALSNF